MQLHQYGNPTPKNACVVDPAMILSITYAGNSQTIPFTRSLGHFRISLTGLLAEWKKGKVRGRTRIEFLSFESFPIQFSF